MISFQWIQIWICEIYFILEGVEIFFEPKDIMICCARMKLCMYFIHELLTNFWFTIRTHRTSATVWTNVKSTSITFTWTRFCFCWRHTSTHHWHHNLQSKCQILLGLRTWQILTNPNDCNTIEKLHKTGFWMHDNFGNYSMMIKWNNGYWWLPLRITNWARLILDLKYFSLFYENAYGLDAHTNTAVPVVEKWYTLYNVVKL